MDPPEVADRLLNTDSNSVPNCQDDREIPEILQALALAQDVRLQHHLTLREASTSPPLEGRLRA
ncbi:hypothetical protein, partial [Streptomyces sp. NPDC056049]|uniref:hypothetical protein n=1 Tax=Streptomyces sp. NPDC056049 TaxID=3345693 RepID=UPI0035D6942F